MRHHTVNYTVSRLLDREIIQPYILCNPHAIGLTDYCIFFNCIGEDKRARQKIIDYCKTSQQVAYFAELTGSYHYTVSLFCKTVFEVTNFFSKLSDLLPTSYFDMSFALRLRFTQLLGRTFNVKVAPVILDRMNAKKISDIDEIDRKILGYYSQNTAKPIKEVARYAGISESAVRYRLKSLEVRGIIISYSYIVDNSKVGIQSYRLIIAANGHNQNIAQALFEFMRKHPDASCYVHCIGSWNFELSFNLEQGSKIGRIIEEVDDAFGSKIRLLYTLQEIAVHRAHHFPLHAGIG